MPPQAMGSTPNQWVDLDQAPKTIVEHGISLHLVVKAGIAVKMLLPVHERSTNASAWCNQTSIPPSAVVGLQLLECF